MNSPRPQLQGIDFNSTNQTFASTDSCRLTKFKPNEATINQKDFPDYESFFLKSPESTMVMKLKDLIEIATELKSFKRSEVIFKEWKMMVANLWDTPITIKEVSPLPPEMIFTMHIPYIAEFALSMKPLLKENKYQEVLIKYETPRSPLQFTVVTSHWTINHIIMPLKSY